MNHSGVGWGVNWMRGRFRDQGGMFSYVSPEARVPTSHPLRRVRALVREVLGGLSRGFSALYAREGRPSVPDMGDSRAEVCLYSASIDKCLAQGAV